MELEKLELIEFLKKYQVRIPPLQRDYAQGRRSQKGLAESFLASIFEALGNDTKLHLDFIYGCEEGGEFLLIDGQQRIATLC